MTLKVDPDEHPVWHAPAPTELGIALADQWSVVLPRVFRYLDQTYIDDFFETGHLRISSFDHFKTHTDEQRLDTQEGTGVHSGVYQSPTDPDDAATLFMVTASGQNHYVLCGSIRESADLCSAFCSDGYFVIENPLGFANEVRRHVPGCIGGIQGHCIYPPSGPGVRRRYDANPLQMFEEAKRPDGSVDIGVLPATASLTVGNEPLFVKQPGYWQQAEYRLLWRVDHFVTGYLDIVCPSARQFCIKIT